MPYFLLARHLYWLPYFPDGHPSWLIFILEFGPYFLAWPVGWFLLQPSSILGILSLWLAGVPSFVR
jgi:hypothetical protein